MPAVAAVLSTRDAPEDHQVLPFSITIALQVRDIQIHASWVLRTEPLPSLVGDNFRGLRPTLYSHFHNPKGRSRRLCADHLAFRNNY